MGYGDVIYDQPTSESIIQKSETIEYNATLVITGVKKKENPRASRVLNYVLNLGNLGVHFGNYDFFVVDHNTCLV